MKELNNIFTEDLSDVVQSLCKNNKEICRIDFVLNNNILGNRTNAYHYHTETWIDADNWGDVLGEHKIFDSAAEHFHKLFDITPISIMSEWFICDGASENLYITTSNKNTTANSLCQLHNITASKKSEDLCPIAVKNQGVVSDIRTKLHDDRISLKDRFFIAQEYYSELIFDNSAVNRIVIIPIISEIIGVRHLSAFIIIAYQLEDTLVEFDLNIVSGLYYKCQSISSKRLTDILNKNIEKEAIRSAVSAIMARNMSHNLGSHIITNTKNEIKKIAGELTNDVKTAANFRGLSELLQYLQERQDFIAVIANGDKYSYGPLNLKSGVFDILAADGLSKRHSSSQPITNYVLNNIVKSENVYRKLVEVTEDSSTQIDIVAINEFNKTVSSFNIENDIAERIPIELQLIDKRDGKTNVFKSLGEKQESASFGNIELAIPYGINGRHAILSIIENVIRNSAKHNDLKKIIKESDLEEFQISIIVEEDIMSDYYQITICDNLRTLKDVKREFCKPDRKILFFDENEKKYKLRTLDILDKDISEGGSRIDKKNKGLKEILICATWLRDSNDFWEIQDSESRVNELLEVVGVKELCTVESQRNIYGTMTNKNNYDVQISQLSEIGDDIIDNYSLGYRFSVRKFKECHIIDMDTINSIDEYFDANRKFDTVYNLPAASLYFVKGRTITDNVKTQFTNILPRVLFESDSHIIDFDNINNIDEYFDANSKSDTVHKLSATSLYFVIGDTITDDVKKQFTNSLPRVLFGSDIDSNDITTSNILMQEHFEKTCVKPILYINDTNSGKAQDDTAKVYKSLISREKDYPKDKDYIEYSTHYEAAFLKEGGTEEEVAKGLFDAQHRKFVEGISGGNYTGNLIRTSLSDRDYMLIAEAAQTKIAIVDERIFAGYYHTLRAKDYEIKDNVLDLMSLPKDNNLFLNIGIYLLSHISELSFSDDEIFPIQNCIEANDGNNLLNILECKYKEIPIRNYKDQYLRGKGIFVLDCTDNGEVKHLDREEESINDLKATQIDYLSIHYSLLEKFKLQGNNTIVDKLNVIFADYPGFNSNTKVAIHSGRGGMIENDLKMAFIPLSGLEWALYNCKYILVDLFTGQKYCKHNIFNDKKL